MAIDRHLATELIILATKWPSGNLGDEFPPARKAIVEFPPDRQWAIRLILWLRLLSPRTAVLLRGGWPQASSSAKIPAVTQVVTQDLERYAYYSTQGSARAKAQAQGDPQRQQPPNRPLQEQNQCLKGPPWSQGPPKVPASPAPAPKVPAGNSRTRSISPAPSALIACYWPTGYWGLRLAPHYFIIIPYYPVYYR